MAGRVAEAMLPDNMGCILPCAPALDRHLEAMAEYADRVFCFYDMQGAGLKQGRRISEGWQARPRGRPSHEMALVAHAESRPIERCGKVHASGAYPAIIALFYAAIDTSTI
jgi:allantoicase